MSNATRCLKCRRWIFPDYSRKHNCPPEWHVRESGSEDDHTTAYGTTAKEAVEWFCKRFHEDWDDCWTDGIRSFEVFPEGRPDKATVVNMEIDFEAVFTVR